MVKSVASTCTTEVMATAPFGPTRLTSATVVKLLARIALLNFSVVEVNGAESGGGAAWS